uniref:Non-specific serine/threonine protein kinase n=1 Tax=Heterorhabditis bacteriophora TaxID=37862 RepID=A0A1I7XQG4_HETBA
MDQLLQSCHSSPSLPQFSENHLKMVQKLLESSSPKMEQLATDSFVTFSNIEESSPSYHRQYDFFISKFSQMCHATYGEDSRKIRSAGLKGLRGVVWKSVTDDLHPNIWEQQHMDKIVPSILYNLQEEDELDGRSKSPGIFDVPFTVDLNRESSPRVLSDRCLRELMGKASFGSLRAVMEPVLKHMDLHSHWTPPPSFAIDCYFLLIILNYINTYSEIFSDPISNQELINHLDSMSTADAVIRIGIATVLSSIVSVAGTSIGPYVATKYRTAYLATVFTDSFLHTLTQLALVNDPQVRLGTQKIFHTLLDRHDNLSHLRHLPYVLDVSDVQLTLEKCSRADQMFMRKHIHEMTQMLYRAVVLVCEDPYLIKHMDAIQCTMSLLCIEVGFDETLIELFRLSLALQSLAVDTTQSFSNEKQLAIHNLVAKYMNLAAQLMANPPLCQHVQQVTFHNFYWIEWLSLKNFFMICQSNLFPRLTQTLIKVVACRAQRGPVGLDLLSDNETVGPADEITRIDLKLISEENGMLFDKNDIAESLKAIGKDVSRLSIPFSASTSKSTEFCDETDGRASSTLPTSNCFYVNFSFMLVLYVTILAGIDDVSVDLSVDWTPPSSTKQSRRNTVFSIAVPTFKPNASGLPLSVNTLRQYANAPVDVCEEERKERELTHAVLDELRSRPFEDRTDSNVERNEGCDLSRTVSRLLARNADTIRMADIGRPPKPKNIFDMDLPAFVY